MFITYNYNGLTCEVDGDRKEDGFEITAYNGLHHNVDIPVEIDGIPVTSIGDSAFTGCTGLTNITIPDSVTYIGISAFSRTAIYDDKSNWENDVLYIDNCLIDAKESISGDYTIKPGTRLIADNAFYECANLTGITIPDSVTSIGSSAFHECSNLTSITIPNSVTSIGYCAFECDNLKEIHAPAHLIERLREEYPDINIISNEPAVSVDNEPVATSIHGQVEAIKANAKTPDISENQDTRSERPGEDRE